MSYQESFKLQMVQLYKNGVTQAELRKEYGLKPSTLNGWIKKYSDDTDALKKSQLSQAEIDNIELKKKLAKLEMENDILKQAALIMGRK